MNPLQQAVVEACAFLENEQIPYALIGGYAVISPEDLIIHKLVAHRPVDLQDVQGILRRQGSALDLKYIRACPESLNEYVWEHNLPQTFEQLLHTVDAQP